MAKIIESELSSYKYLIGSYNHRAVAEQVHSILTQKFPTYSNTFLIPKYLNTTIVWSLPDSSIVVNQRKTYSQLNDVVKKKVEEHFNAIARVFNHLATDYDFIKEFGTSICTMPSIDDVQVLSTNKGELITVANWGFIPFDKNKQFTSFAKVIPKKIKLTPVQLRCIVSNGEILPNEDIYIAKGNHPVLYTSNESGLIEYEELVDGHEIKIHLKNNEQFSELQTIRVKEGVNIYDVIINKFSSLRIRVVNVDDEPVSQYLLNCDGEQFNTSHNGEVVLENLPVGEHMVIKTSDNYETTVEIAQNEAFIEIRLEPVVIPPPPPEDKVNLFFYDHKKNPILDLEVDLSHKGQSIPSINIEGNHFEVLKDDLPTEGKILAVINPKNSKPKKCTFKHANEDTEHHLYLKKKLWMWALLLLPLSLLMLLVFNQNLEIGLYDQNGNTISNGKITVTYEQCFLYDFGINSFHNENTYEESLITDSIGTAFLENVQTSLFDHLFHRNRPIIFSVQSDSTCWDGFVQNRILHSLGDSVQLNVNNAIKGAYFIDSKSRAAILDLTFDFTSMNQSKHSLKSNTEGIVYTQAIGLCDEITDVRIYKKGYLTKGVESIVVQKEYNPTSNMLEFQIRNALACDEVDTGKNNQDATLFFTFPDPDQKYILDYNFDSLPDNLKLYAGEGYSGELLFDETLVMEGEIVIIPREFCNGCENITAKISADSYWEIKLDCP
ncbi:hypothetical protein N9P97_02065 [Saprospiraceae bacterium]|nr:hypothetical protein [Saprospiraceae bacterium]